MVAARERDLVDDPVAMPPDPVGAWSSLDPDGPPRAVWIRPAPDERIVVLLGAFDPPTNAHVAVVRAAAAADRSAPVLCSTKTLLARPRDGLLPITDRLRLVDAVARAGGFGYVLCNRGTYIDVAAAFRLSGHDPSFAIGSDKLTQLADPSFYPDGEAGVERTFDEVRFLVVPRPDRTSGRPGLHWLDPDDVFAT